MNQTKNPNAKANFKFATALILPLGKIN